MNRTALAVLFVLTASTALGDTERSRFDQSFPADGVRSIVIDNIYGPMTITTGAASIRVAAEIKAIGGRRSSASGVLAEWPLVIERKGSALEVLVDAPMRCSDRGWRCSHDSDDRDRGRAEYAFTIEVPDGITVEARTIEGDVDLRGTVDEFILRNVNGGVFFEGDARGGSASTVNGPVAGRFRTTPTVDSKYSSVNDEIDLYFPPALDALFAISTLNGEILTDFDWQATSVAEMERTRREGTKWVVRNAGRTGVRIGSGATRIEIDTLNGDIMIRKGN
ncbi:MAG: hypothetical protein KY459_05710 [Acidobacteria bacterium]|nr:hypothetical protein [Acidobacteriota bacterium]